MYIVVMMSWHWDGSGWRKPSPASFDLVWYTFPGYQTMTNGQSCKLASRAVWDKGIVDLQKDFGGPSVSNKWNIDQTSKTQAGPPLGENCFSQTRALDPVARHVPFLSTCGRELFIKFRIILFVLQSFIKLLYLRGRFDLICHSI